MSALDGTIDSPNFDVLVELIKKERLNRLHPFNRLNTSWKLIYTLYALTKLRVDCQFNQHLHDFKFPLNRPPVGHNCGHVVRTQPLRNSYINPLPDQRCLRSVIAKF